MGCRIAPKSSFLQVRTLLNGLSPCFPGLSSVCFLILFNKQQHYLSRKMINGKILDPCFTHGVFRIDRSNIFEDRVEGSTSSLASTPTSYCLFPSQHTLLWHPYPEATPQSLFHSPFHHSSQILKQLLLQPSPSYTSLIWDSSTASSPCHVTLRWLKQPWGHLPHVPPSTLPS